MSELSRLIVCLFLVWGGRIFRKKILKTRCFNQSINQLINSITSSKQDDLYFPFWDVMVWISINLCWQATLSSMKQIIICGLISFHISFKTVGWGSRASLIGLSACFSWLIESQKDRGICQKLGIIQKARLNSRGSVWGLSVEIDLRYFSQLEGNVSMHAKRELRVLSRSKWEYGESRKGYAVGRIVRFRTRWRGISTATSVLIGWLVGEFFSIVAFENTQV